MEMCNVMEEGLRRASELALYAANLMAEGKHDEALKATVTSNGLMLGVICHGLFAHDEELDHGPELWKGLFDGRQPTDD